jgi:mannose-6-phosphate isomerase-like protein (cupin superfamily)
MLYGKIWGSTQCIFNKNNVSIYRIAINKNAKCSKHYHLHKFNTFFIESGVLKISIYQKDYPLVDETILKSGDSTTVKPGLFHIFEALEDTIAYEIYYTELNEDDIFRENCGSK